MKMSKKQCQIVKDTMREYAEFKKQDNETAKAICNDCYWQLTGMAKMFGGSVYHDKICKIIMFEVKEQVIKISYYGIVCEIN